MTDTGIIRPPREGEREEAAVADRNRLAPLPKRAEADLEGDPADARGMFTDRAGGRHSGGGGFVSAASGGRPYIQAAHPLVPDVGIAEGRSVGDMSASVVRPEWTLRRVAP